MSIYEEVTNAIIAELEKGAAPWVKPWRPSGKVNSNAITGKAYQGVNRLILGMQWRPSHEWATFKQWQSVGASVKKGEKGTHIVFYSPVVKKTTNDQGEEESSAYNLLKTFVVFNAAQVDGYTAPIEEEGPGFNPIRKCEDTIIHTGATILHDGADRAFYRTSSDTVHMPARQSFISPENYYATAFHELTHWTGHASRLDRTKGKRFGDNAYAYEELIAELGAAFLCEDHAIQGDLRHAGYIQSWLKALKDDKRLIFKAAAAASKAADYIKRDSIATIKAAA